MVKISGEIVIERPLEVVFDYIADERHEPSYNHRLLRADKVTEGPIGEGTRFVAAIRSVWHPLEMVVDITGYERPRRLSSTTTMASASVRGTLTFEPDPLGTRMHWSWDLQPKGALRLLGPLIARIGKRQELDTWRSAKRRLETAGAPPRPLP